VRFLEQAWRMMLTKSAARNKPRPAIVTDRNFLMKGYQSKSPALVAGVILSGLLSVPPVLAATNTQGRGYRITCTASARTT